jgi:hypothetical protein
MLKKSALISILSLYTSNHFGSTFATYKGDSTTMDNCTYTQTKSGENISYLSLIEIAAREKLPTPSTFLTQLRTVISKQDANPNWTISPEDHQPFMARYSLLRIVLLKLITLNNQKTKNISRLIF